MQQLHCILFSSHICPLNVNMIKTQTSQLIVIQIEIQARHPIRDMISYNSIPNNHLRSLLINR